jgi:SAM-dependent methyltransferase
MPDTIASFDNYAAMYDGQFTYSPIGKLQRLAVHRNIPPLLSTKNLNILEINCGTGYDALHFANMGHKVTATDLSEKMIQVATSNASRKQFKNLSFEILDITDLDNLKANEKFDVLFSNFGGLNCLRKKELNQFFKDSVQQLNANGKLILVLMPKFCLWEWFYFFISFRWDILFRRLEQKGAKTTIEGNNFLTFYYNPKEIIKLTSENYIVESLKPIGLFVPPSFMNKRFKDSSYFLGIFNYLDKLIEHNSFFAPFADHYLICLKKRA